jgi:tRNA(Ile2) C34 agmatinyltransferase TiaS
VAGRPAPDRLDVDGASTRVAMPLPDPSIPVSCPLCGRTLAYKGRAHDCQIYRCRTDGRMVVHPDGTIRPPEGRERNWVARPADAADAPPRDAIVATKKPICPNCGRPTTLLAIGYWANVYECPACGERVSGAK